MCFGVAFTYKAATRSCGAVLANIVVLYGSRCGIVIVALDKASSVAQSTPKLLFSFSNFVRDILVTISIRASIRMLAFH
jgi:hypothetical protein